jgi:predicted transcriptional regulator
MISGVAGERALTVRIAPDVYRRVEELAKREKRSMSAQAAYLIEQALAMLPDDLRTELARPARKRRGTK